MLTSLAQLEWCGGRSRRTAVKRYIGWALVAFAFYLVVQFPNDSVQIITGSIDLLGRLAEQSANFVRGMMNA